MMLQRSGNIVLASASATRSRLLRSAGLDFSIFSPNLDERGIEAQMREEGLESAEISQALAEAKALAGSESFPDSHVIGADQVLECEGSSFSKPKNMESARAQLKALSGRTHHLISSAAVARKGKILWTCREQASLAVRPLSEDFIDAYLGQAGDDVLDSVGAYQLEGLGANIFSAVEGDYFTILGIPLIPLLAFLRQEGVLKD